MMVKKLFPILCNRGMRVILYKLYFLFPQFFFSTKQMSFPSLYFSTIPTKHKWRKLKSLLSSYFSIIYLSSILPLLRFLIPISCLSPFVFLPLIVLTTLNICITWLELHFGKQNVSDIVDHSIFSDYTCSIGHSKIYSNYLFIYFCKKRKKKEKKKRKEVRKQALQIAMPLTFTTSHLPCSSLFIVKHFPPISIFIYQKKQKNWKFWSTVGSLVAFTSFFDQRFFFFPKFSSFHRFLYI